MTPADERRAVAMLLVTGEECPPVEDDRLEDLRGAIVSWCLTARVERVPAAQLPDLLAMLNRTTAYRGWAGYVADLLDGLDAA